MGLGKGVPLPNGVESGEGAVPPPRKKFDLNNTLV